MPMHEVGYRPWQGDKVSPWTRWWIITSTGVRLAQKSRWVKRLLFLAWLPVMYWGIGFFVIENTLNGQAAAFVQNSVSDAAGDLPLTQQAIPMPNRRTVANVIRNRFQMIPKVEILTDALVSEDADVTRNTVWRWLLMTFFRYPQGLLILFLVGTIAPALISRDLRSRAFLLYFSRPIGRLEYLLGKLLIPATFMALVTMLPALALYFFAIMMSPDWSVFGSTWDIPLRIVASTFALVVPVSALSVMLSSLTQESRFANFSWFAFWAMGQVAWIAVLFSQAMTLRRPPFDPVVTGSEASQRWSIVSIYNNLGNVQAWIFGFEPLTKIYPSVVLLIALTIGSCIILYRRVSSPIRS